MKVPDMSRNSGRWVTFLCLLSTVMPFVATNGFETKTTSFFRDQSLLTTKYLMEVFSHGESGFRGFISLVVSFKGKIRDLPPGRTR